MSTTEIINDFVNQIDTEKAYTFKKLKDILEEVYKASNAEAKKAEKKPKKKAAKDAQADAEPKAKRPPSAYNNFVKQRIQELKQERTDVAPRDLMKLAASEWKQLSKQEQEAYKM
jgi:hypothetical protein